MATPHAVPALQVNDFTSDLPLPHPIVHFGADGGQGIVKNNTMRYTGEKSTVAAGRKITPDGKDEAEVAGAEEKLQNILPAISNIPGPKSMSLLIIEGNIIQGWTTDAIALNAAQPPNQPPANHPPEPRPEVAAPPTPPPAQPPSSSSFPQLRLIVRGNSLEGAIRLTGLPQSYHGLLTDNLNLQTLLPVQPIIVPQEPAVE